MERDGGDGVRGGGEELVEDLSEGIRETLQRRKAYGIDTMAFIYHFEGNPTYTPFTKPLFELIEAGEPRTCSRTMPLNLYDAKFLILDMS